MNVNSHFGAFSYVMVFQEFESYVLLLIKAVIFMLLPPDNVGEGITMFSGCLSVSFIWPFIFFFRQILLPQCLTNVLSSLDETYSEYSLAPTDDPIRFWKSEVKGQGHSRPLRWQRHARRR